MQQGCNGFRSGWPPPKLLILQRKGMGVGPPHPARGQALVLFAMSIVVLLLLVGLSIDGLRVYIAYGQAQRAAEAAALAGVIYLPQYPTSATPAPDGKDATDRALQIAAANGFPNASDVTVTPISGTVPELQVTIHVLVALSLIALVNPSPTSVLPSATAEILPPLTLGDTTNSFGDKVENITEEKAGMTSLNELKERGDPYTVQCESGWSAGSDLTHSDASSPIYYTSTLHVATNAPQYPAGPNCSPGSPGNPDQIPAGFGGLATRTSPVATGTSYLITIPAANSGYSVWVWNPRFVYTASGNNSLLFPQENIYSGLYTDNPMFYPQMAYTLFSVPQWYNRGADVPLAAIWPYATTPNTAPNAPLNAGQIVTLPALDANPWDLALHGCSSTGAWNLSGGNSYVGPITSGTGCLSTLPSDYGQWVQVGTQLLASTATSPTYARLTVDTNTGYGQHAYAVKVCYNATVATGCSANGATISAWNADTVMLRGGTSQSYPLINIPAAYAGRQITLNLFNPGISTENALLPVVPPASGGTVTYPTWLRMGTSGGYPAINASQSGDNLYHSKWVNVTLNLPPDYAGGEWDIIWSGSTAPTTALMTVSAKLIGNPVSLVR